ncbi:MAG: hypothetical protein IIZ12_08800, partial [Eggerthellaceae bacterium]|nr:hypothetical protein [Eggerthellaceae bacterium]
MPIEIDIAKHLQPIVIGGDILAYSWVREMHRAFGITRTIVLATQDIKMLSSSKFTDYRLVDGLYEGDTAYEALEAVAAEELAVVRRGLGVVFRIRLGIVGLGVDRVAV